MNATLRIALIDDDRGWTDALADFFAAHGFTVATAPDATVGLALLAHDDFESAVVDYHMPGLDGLGLLHELRRRRRLLPVVLVSADEEAHLAERAREAGAFAFLPKTVSPRLLLQTVHQALHRRTERPWAHLLPAPSAPRDGATSQN
jgi:DNA-binding response OmpR family regulator